MSEEHLAATPNDGTIACQTPPAWVNGSLTGLGPLLVDHGCQTMTGVLKRGPKVGPGEVSKVAKARDINAGYYPEVRIIPLRAKDYTYTIPAEGGLDADRHKMKNDAAKSKTAQKTKSTEKTKSAEKTKSLEKVKAVPDEATLVTESVALEQPTSPKKSASEETKVPKVSTPRKDVIMSEMSALDILRGAEAAQPHTSTTMPEAVSLEEAPQTSPSSTAERPSEVRQAELEATIEDDDSSSSGGEADYIFKLPTFGDDDDDDNNSEADVEMSATEEVEYLTTPAAVAPEPVKVSTPQKKASPTKAPAVEPVESAVVVSSPRKTVVPATESSNWLLNDDSSDSSDSEEQFLFEEAASKAMAMTEGKPVGVVAVSEGKPAEEKTATEKAVMEDEPDESVGKVKAATKHEPVEHLEEVGKDKSVEDAEEEPPVKKRKKSPKKSKPAKEAPTSSTVPEPVRKKLSTPKKSRRNSMETRAPDSTPLATAGGPSKTDSVSSEDFGVVIPEFGGDADDEAPASAAEVVKKTAHGADKTTLAKATERVAHAAKNEQEKVDGETSPVPSGRSSRKSTGPTMGTVVSVEVGNLKGHTPQTLFEALVKSIAESGGDKSQLVEVFWPRKSQFAFLNTRAGKSRRSSWIAEGSIIVDGQKCEVCKVEEKSQKHSVAQEMKDSRSDPERHAGWTPEGPLEVSKESSAPSKSKATKRKRESAVAASTETVSKPQVYRDEKVYEQAVEALRSTQGLVTKGSLLHKAVAELLKKKVPHASECEFELSQGQDEVDPKVTIRKADGSSEVWTAAQVAETTKTGHKASSRMSAKMRKTRQALKKRVNK